MNELLIQNLASLKSLCSAYKVKNLYAFGSVLTDKFTDNSDVDFLVSFTPEVDLLDYADNFFDFRDNVKLLLGREIDLVEESSISNPYFMKEINKNKVHIYG